MQDRTLKLKRNKQAHIDTIVIEYEFYNEEVKRAWLSVKLNGPKSMLQVHTDFTHEPNIKISVCEKLGKFLIKKWKIREDQ